MSKLFPLQYAKILYELTFDLAEEKISPAIDAFILLLKKNQSINKLPYIIKEFEIYAQKKQGVQKAVVTSAVDLSQKTIEEIKKSLDLKGEVIVNIDKKIIGGVTVRVGDNIFDASLKTQINKLKQQLI